MSVTPQDIYAIWTTLFLQVSIRERKLGIKLRECAAELDSKLQDEGGNNEEAAKRELEALEDKLHATQVSTEWR